MEQKKNKHITINLTEEQYNIIEQIAEQDNRTLTNTLYIIVNQAIKTACFGRLIKPTLAGYEYQPQTKK